MDWYKDFTIDYVLMIPPMEKIGYTIKKDFGNDYFKKEGSYKVKLNYDFSENSYRIDQSKDSCNILFKKMSSLRFSGTSKVTIK